VRSSHASPEPRLRLQRHPRASRRTARDLQARHHRDAPDDHDGPIVEGREPPYEDRVEEGGAILYRYRGTDPRHPDNAGLRLAMQRQTPLIYLYGLVPGRYLPVWPVYIVATSHRRSPSKWPSTTQGC